MALTYPYTIVAATDVDAAPIQGNFDAIKTLVDTLGAGAEDTTWRTLRHGQVGPLTNSTFAGAATWMFGHAGSLFNIASPGTSYSPLVFYLDDADHTLTGETPTLRVRGTVLTNATAPTINFVYGLHEVTASAGSAGNLTPTVNSTAVTNSTATVTAPSLSTRNVTTTSAFTYPSDGYYTFAVAASGAMAASAAVGLQVELQVKVT